jgi:hypothetical protein
LQTRISLVLVNFIANANLFCFWVNFIANSNLFCFWSIFNANANLFCFCFWSIFVANSNLLCLRSTFLVNANLFDLWSNFKSQQWIHFHLQTRIYSVICQISLKTRFFFLVNFHCKRGSILFLVNFHCKGEFILFLVDLHHQHELFGIGQISLPKWIWHVVFSLRNQIFRFCGKREFAASLSIFTVNTNLSGCCQFSLATRIYCRFSLQTRIFSVSVVNTNLVDFWSNFHCRNELILFW